MATISSGTGAPAARGVLPAPLVLADVAAPPSRGGAD